MKKKYFCIKNEKGTKMVREDTNHGGSKYLEFDVRNSQEILNKSGNVLKSNSKVRIYKTDIYKSISSGDGKNITNTIQVFK